MTSMIRVQQMRHCTAVTYKLFYLHAARGTATPCLQILGWLYTSNPARLADRGSTQTHQVEELGIRPVRHEGHVSKRDDWN